MSRRFRSRKSPSAATSTGTSSTRLTPTRRWRRRSVRATGSRCATGSPPAGPARSSRVRERRLGAVATVVIPFAGAAGKTRLHTSAEVRGSLALAMLADVLAAATAVGRTRVVTPGTELIEPGAGVEVVADPGGGQGAAVAAAVAGVRGPILVVNADLPCVTPSDLLALADSMPALVAAADGTTNALSLA